MLIWAPTFYSVNALEKVIGQIQILSMRVCMCEWILSELGSPAGI